MFKDLKQNIVIMSKQVKKYYRKICIYKNINCWSEDYNILNKNFIVWALYYTGKS